MLALALAVKVLAIAVALVVVSGVTYSLYRYTARDPLDKAFRLAARLLNEFAADNPLKRRSIEILVTAPEDCIFSSAYYKALVQAGWTSRKAEVDSDQHGGKVEVHYLDRTRNHDSLRPRAGVNTVSHEDIFLMKHAGYLRPKKTVLIVVSKNHLLECAHTSDKLNRMGTVVIGVTTNAMTRYSPLGRSASNLIQVAQGKSAQYRLLVLILHQMLDEADGNPDSFTGGMVDLDRDTRIKLVRIFNAVLALWKGDSPDVFLKRNNNNGMSPDDEQELYGWFTLVQHAPEYGYVQALWTDAGARYQKFGNSGMRARFRAMARFILNNRVLDNGNEIHDFVPDPDSLLGFAMKAPHTPMSPASILKSERHYTERIAMEIPGLSQRQSLMAALCEISCPITVADLYESVREVHIT